MSIRVARILSFEENETPKSFFKDGITNQTFIPMKLTNQNPSFTPSFGSLGSSLGKRKIEKLKGSETPPRKKIKLNEINFFLSMPVTNCRNSIPNTPCKRRKTIEKIFSEEIPLSVLKNSVFFEFLDSWDLTYATYKSPDGRELFILKQCSNKSCTGTAALMIMIDILSENNNEEQIKEFFENNKIFEEFFNCYLWDSKETLRFLKNADFLNPKMKKVANKDIYSEIEKIIDQTKHSVLLGIDHPKINGHRLVVDGIKDGFLYVRDSFTMKAYKVSKKEFFKSLDQECYFQDIIYFE
ncbi:MAG: hypothetical protein AMS24_00930 [Chlamydiae bacterium SM23_39]|nr:MAG: hypothetical protein AMS24_00930 [Chlamydiae bacterium SM23_39]